MVMQAGGVGGAYQSQFGLEPRENTFRSNAIAIFNKMEQQFIKAVMDVNAGCYSKGNIGIYFSPQADSNKFGVPLGKEFDYPISYHLWIVEGPEMNYESPWGHQESKRHLFLGEKTLYSDTWDREKLIEMARVGNINAFDNVYDDWYAKLSDEINFFQQNASQIKETKEKIRKQCALAFDEASKYGADSGLEISTSPVQRFDHSFEPLANMSLHKVMGNAYYYLGSFSPLNANRFKQVVEGDHKILEEVYKRSLAQMKALVDKEKPSPYWWSCNIL